MRNELIGMFFTEGLCMSINLFYYETYAVRDDFHKIQVYKYTNTSFESPWRRQTKLRDYFSVMFCQDDDFL